MYNIYSYKPNQTVHSSIYTILLLDRSIEGLMYQNLTKKKKSA